jgi:hypothetical protein
MAGQGRDGVVGTSLRCSLRRRGSNQVGVEASENKDGMMAPGRPGAVSKEGLISRIWLQ